MQTLDPEGKKWQSALWEVDPAGRRPARRLTRSAPGESAPACGPDGSLLFTSARPDPGEQGERRPQGGALWRCPPVAARPAWSPRAPAGIGRSPSPRDTGDVVVRADATRRGRDAEADEAPRKPARTPGSARCCTRPTRSATGTTTSGRGEPHLFSAGPPTGDDPTEAPPPARPDPGPGAGRPGCRGRLRRLPRRPAARRAAADTRRAGRPRATGSCSPRRHAARRAGAGGRPARRGRRGSLLPRRRGGRSCERTARTSDEPPDYTLLLVDLAERRDPRPDGRPRPLAERAAVQRGRPPPLLPRRRRRPARDLPGGRRRRRPGDRLTADGAYSDLQVARDGAALFALRSGTTRPPVPVRLDPPAPGRARSRCRPRPPRRPARHAARGRGHGRRTAPAAVAGWCCPRARRPRPPAPAGALDPRRPADGWNAWSWRWCPWVLAARGYAVLLPNPALSTASARSSSPRLGRLGRPRPSPT